MRVCLPMQGTQVWFLLRADPTCHMAAEPMSHSYSAESLCSSREATTVKSLLTAAGELPLLPATRESLGTAMKTWQRQRYINKY